MSTISQQFESPCQQIWKARESDSTDPSSHTPFRHLNSPEKAICYQCEHALRRSCQHKIAHLSDKLETSTQQKVFVEDIALHDDLFQIVAENAQTVFPLAHLHIYFGTTKRRQPLWRMHGRWGGTPSWFGGVFTSVIFQVVHTRPCMIQVPSGFHHREHFTITLIIRRLQLGFQRRWTSNYKLLQRCHCALREKSVSS